MFAPLSQHIMDFVNDALGAGEDLVNKGKDGLDQAVDAAKGAVNDLVADNIEALIEKITSSDWCQEFVEKFTKAYIDKHAAWLPLVITIIGILTLLGITFVLYIIFASFKQLFKQGQCWCCVCCKHKLPDKVREKPKEHGLHLWGRWDSQWVKGLWRGVKDAAGVVSNAVRQSGALERAAEAGIAVRNGAIAAGNTAYRNGQHATGAAKSRWRGAG